MPTTDTPDFLVADLAVSRGFASRDEVWPLFAVWLANPNEPFLQRLAGARLLSAADVDLLGSLAHEQLLSSRRSTTGLGWEPMEDTDVTANSTPSPAETATIPDAEHRVAGQFRVVREHAQGGLGRVSVAIDERLGREVALKEIRPDKQHRHDLKARFIREACVAGQLEHPGIVPVYAFGEHENGQPYYAMRFVGGETLADAIQRFHADNSRFDSLEFRQLLTRFIAVCEAMAYAHDKGVIHRDLKPANIMLGQYGETQVVDWGLAKRLNEPTVASPDVMDTDATLSMGAIGTPAYMSPEQAAGRIEDVGPTSDIYSLGATLYHLLTGRSPNAGHAIVSVLANAERGTVDPPRRSNSSVPKALEAVCQKAMAFRPADRYPSAKSLGADVEQWLTIGSVSVLPLSRIERLHRWVRRQPAEATLIGLVTYLVARSAGRFSYQHGILAISEEWAEYLGSLLGFCTLATILGAFAGGISSSISWNKASPSPQPVLYRSIRFALVFAAVSLTFAIAVYPNVLRKAKWNEAILAPK
ncbi:MAG: serine/threonine protein kinase [Gemmataceae bacterium]|nr:serine/threonine protein kinase [Gemmataceae bacterium]